MIISAIFCIAGISFFVAAGKPGLGFGLSVAGGVTNIVQDYVLIAVIPLGGCRRCLCHSSRLYSASCHRDYVFHYKSKRCALFGAPEVSWKSTGQSLLQWSERDGGNAVGYHNNDCHECNFDEARRSGWSSCRCHHSLSADNFVGKLREIRAGDRTNHQFPLRGGAFYRTERIVSYRTENRCPLIPNHLRYGISFSKANRPSVCIWLFHSIE